MKFKYQAKTKEGEAQAGFVEAKNRDGALTILNTHNLFVLSLTEAETIHWWDRVASYFGRVRRKDMVIFTRQLATLLEARLPLKEALRTLHKQTGNPVLKEAVLQISQDIDSGLSLSQAMERQGTIFSDFYISMVRASEVTGKLDEVAGFLADYSEKEGVLISKAISSMIYPLTIIGLFIVVAFIMISFVFPQVEPVFSQSGVKLPLLTRILLGTGDFMGRWWAVLVFAFVALVAMFLDYFQTEEGKSILDDSKVRLPIVSRVYLPLIIARFSNALSLLLRSGIPMSQALEIVGHTVDNVLYQELFHEVSESVRQGGSLSDALGKYPFYFPPLVSQMVAVGEATGQVDQIFVRLANFYGREADTIIGNLVDLIQPMLMIGIGVLVGLLFASILLPLYQLTSTIR